MRKDEESIKHYPGITWGQFKRWVENKQIEDDWVVEALPIGDLYSLEQLEIGKNTKCKWFLVWSKKVN